MEPIYVNFIDGDGSNGIVAMSATLDKFLFNIKYISTTYYKHIREISNVQEEFYDMKTIGRFITFIIYNHFEKKSAIQFFDTMNDEKIAKICKNIRKS